MLFCNFSYDNSQDNSYIEKIDYIDFTRMSNTFNNTIKNQVENNHVIDGKLRRKDSAIELEDINNSFSGSKYFGIEKVKSSKSINSNGNKNVDFIVGDNSSEDGSSDELFPKEKIDIFNFEIEPIKNQQNKNSSTSSISLYQTFKYKSNQNLDLINKTINKKDIIRDDTKENIANINSKGINLVRNNLDINHSYKSNNDYITNNQKISFQKNFNYLINGTPKKEGKIKFGNISNELKNSPTKYNGLDILKPILKKRNINNKEVSISYNSLYKNVESLPKKKKSVHFKSENEECPFKKFECPSNIVNLPIYVVDSRLEPFLEAKLVKLKGFSSKKKVQLPWDKNVILESVGLIDDEEQEHDILKLTIQVRNIAFEKKVNVYFTFNDWETVEIQEAKYRSSEKNDRDQSIDKFTLKIDTDCDGESTCNIQFAIQYLVDHQEYWDNNNGDNYSLKVDRTVRIPAKAIKSHPFCEGPVVKYKLKPGYHYPLFKSNLTEHPSADIPVTTTVHDSKCITTKNTHIISTTITSSTTNANNSPISSLENTISSIETNKLLEKKKFDVVEKSENCFKIKGLSTNTHLFVDRNTLENIISPTFINEQENNFTNNCINSEWADEEKENTADKEFFSWNEPILLRKPNIPERHYRHSNHSMGKSELTMIPNDSNIILTGKHYSNNEKEDENSKNNCNDYNNNENNNSNYHSIIDSNMKLLKSKDFNDPKYPLDNAFELPKHENWFKEAPSCIQFSTSPRKLYHHTNNFKLLNHHSLSKSLFDNKTQTLAISKKEKAEEEENKKRLNSKYSNTTHLPSSSSKYMRNNLYSNYQSIYPIYLHPSCTPTTTSLNPSTNSEISSTIKHNDSLCYPYHSNYNNFHNNCYSNNIQQNSCYLSNSKYLQQNSCFSSNATPNEITQISNETSTFHNDYNIYSDSHLYATQEDFINDNFTYF